MQRLRVLPKLIILDLSGNPCTAGSSDDYRLYVIYNVRKLKVRACVNSGVYNYTHMNSHCRIYTLLQCVPVCGVVCAAQAQPLHCGHS